MKRIVLIIVFGLLTSQVHAADPDPIYTPPQAPGPIDPATILIKLAAITAIALTICVLTVVFFRKRMAGRTKGIPGRLTHRGMLALSGRTAVHLIKADEHLVAVSTDSSGLKSMVILSEPFEDVLARTALEQAQSTKIIG